MAMERYQVSMVMTMALCPMAMERYQISMPVGALPDGDGASTQIGEEDGCYVMCAKLRQNFQKSNTCEPKHRYPRRWGRKYLPSNFRFEKSTISKIEFFLTKIRNLRFRIFSAHSVEQILYYEEVIATTSKVVKILGKLLVSLASVSNYKNPNDREVLGLR